jgi:hypothetical protein
MQPMNSQNRIPIRSVAYRSTATGAIRPIAHPGARIFTVRPASGTVVHRLSSVARQPEVIDLEAEPHGQIRSQPIRQYANYSINGEGISRVRYAVPPINRRPIYARPALRPTYYRTYPSVPQTIGRHRIIPYIPRYPNFRRYDYETTEEDIDHAIQMEESKMQQEENSYFYTDPDFQRIEANIVKKENMARQQLEKQRLATLTSYQSRSSDINVVQNRQIQQAVQKMMSARSELSLKANDTAFDTDVKMSLKSVIEQVCQQDKEEGWHKNILQKIRRVPEVPVLHSQPLVKRSIQKHSEVMLNERSEFFKREILKRRARLELDVELEYGFVKQTRTGTIACLPCSQIYARIGAPMPDEEFIVKQEPKIEVEENYVYEPIKEEYSMESESIDSSGIDITEQYIDTSVNSNIKTEILDSSSTSDHGRKSGGKVEVIRGIKGGNNGKRTKTGRPTNKEKRQIERETKKNLKKQQKDLSHDLQQFCGTKTCYCQKIFDPAQDYIKCSTCSNLFHPKCAKISLSKAEKMNHWACKYCDPNETEPKEQDETATEEILCICNEPYDSNSHWIGCNLCDKWFHPECVQTTIEAVQAAGEYICHSCAFDRASQRETAEEPIQQNIDDGVYYA